jgi:hypothetical protein
MREETCLLYLLSISLLSLFLSFSSQLHSVPLSRSAFALMASPQIAV